MTQRPLLIFPNPTNVARTTLNAPPPSYNFPSQGRQRARIEPMFRALEQAFENNRINIERGMTGIFPEQVLIFEIAGSIEDFMNTIKKTPGFEFLVEWEETLEADEDFYATDRPERDINGRLFVTMSNQQAIRELQSLWQLYINNRKFPHGFGRWKALFSQLKDIRKWNINDRLLETGILEDWAERVRQNEETIKFEIELWYRQSPEKRNSSSREINTILRQQGGQVIGELVINEISYHGILAEAPIGIFNDLTENTQISLVKCDYIMYFRPVGQAVVMQNINEQELDTCPGDENVDEIENLPIIALLDGLPLENHSMLEGKLIIDDPDGWAGNYRPQDRKHGTFMSSLIANGELDDTTRIPLNRKIYVRPIMKTSENDFRDNKVEFIPEDILPIDIVHRAVVRMFEGENGEPPVAPTVKIINLSIGDCYRPFNYSMSPWARLVDWLSYKYNILFIISSGNCIDNIELDTSNFATISNEEKEKRVMKAIYNGMADRRILSPSEAINALTVGAIHSDMSTITRMGFRSDPLNSQNMPSPVSRFGLGFRRSIKPEILMPGGRQLYMQLPNTLQIDNSILAPGHKVAAPSSTGELDKTCYIRGTSNASALTSRLGAQVYENIYGLLHENGVPTDYIPQYIKAIIVHSASWGISAQLLADILDLQYNKAFKDQIASRILGYGIVDSSRVFYCTDQRVTLLGQGTLNKDQANVFSLPLPPSLISSREWRRLTITLAWFSPVNGEHQKYRKAKLWFEPPTGQYLDLQRNGYDWQNVQRGTIQHEILEGTSATPYIDGSELVIKVNCREDAGKLREPIRYALIATLEVREGINLPIYQEVRDRVRLRIPIHT